MVKVLIKKLDPTVQLPEYKTNGASGVDLTAFIKETINLKPKKSVLVPTGLSVAFSEDFEIQIRPRSGLAAKKNISVLDRQNSSMLISFAKANALVYIPEKVNKLKKGDYVETFILPTSILT